MATPVKTGGNARGPRGGASVSTATITSRDNRWLKEFRLALRGGLATETGAVGVEGVRLVEEALRSGCPIDAVLFSESGERHRERLAPVIDRPEIAIPILRTTDRLFEGVADTEHPQGVAALVRPRPASFDELLKTPEAPVPHCWLFWLACKTREMSGRYSHGFRIRCDGRGDCGFGTERDGESVFAESVARIGWRGAASADRRGDVVANSADATKSGGSANPRIGGTCERRHPAGDADGASDAVFAPWDVDWCKPVAMLVGNEGAGLPREVEQSADARIRIPMASGIESLNAAAAAAVLFYEAARQRKIVVNIGGAKA